MDVMHDRPDLDAGIDGDLPYALDVQVWGRHGPQDVDRLKEHAGDAFGSLGAVDLVRQGGPQCLAPTYHLFIRHVLGQGAPEADMLAGHKRLLGFLRADRQARRLPPLRLRWMDTWNPRRVRVEDL